MKHIDYQRTATVFLAIMVVTMLAPPCHAQFIPYDIFTAGVIDPDKWQGISTEGSASRPAAEVLRTAEDGAFRARLVGWGDNTSNMGSFVTRQGLNIVQLGTYGTSGYINGLKAKVTVLDTEVQDCLTNQESNAPALAQAQLIATFFNDGTSPAAVTRQATFWASSSCGRTRMGPEPCSRPSTGSRATGLPARPRSPSPETR